MSLEDVMSVQDMADYLGVSRATLSRWMADKGAPPRRAYIAQWALATDVPIEWLEKGEEPHDPSDGDSTLVRSYRIAA